MKAWLRRWFCAHGYHAWLFDTAYKQGPYRATEVWIRTCAHCGHEQRWNFGWHDAKN